MIVFEIYRNGKRLCRAGGDRLEVLTAILAWGGDSAGSVVTDDSERFSHLHFSVQGLEYSKRGTDRHPRWVRGLELEPGDRIEVRIKELVKADPPISVGPSIQEKAGRGLRPSRKGRVRIQKKGGVPRGRKS